MARTKRSPVQETVQPEKVEQLANDVEEEVTDTVDEPKTRPAAHSTKAMTIDVDGKQYMRFAGIAKIMGCAFQQVYQRSHKEKNPMAYVKENGILYGRVSDIDAWKQEKVERAARKELRAKEKAEKLATKALKEAAKLAQAEASADDDVEVETPDA